MARRAARRVSCGSASTTRHVTVRPARAGCASCCPTRVELVAGRRTGRAAAGGQGAGGGRADPGRRRGRGRCAADSCWSRGWRAGPSASWPSRWSAAMREPRRSAARRSIRSSPPGRTARCRTPRPRDVRDRPGRARGDRLGRRARRLLLGLHADGGHRRVPAPRRGRSTSWCSTPSWAASRRVRAGAGGREVDAAAREVIEAARARRALRSRPRPRGRERRSTRRRGSRCAPRTSCEPATSSRSSRGSTCRAASGCGSRIWWCVDRRRLRDPHLARQGADGRRLTRRPDSSTALRLGPGGP